MKDAEHQVMDTDSLDTEEACAKMWSVYVSQAEKYDKALVAGWRADMKGLLIFAGLFSGSLTAFIIESYQTLLPNSGDSTAVFLAQISRQLNASIESSAPEFTPTTSALLCNYLWFISLGLSLTCALTATLVEQWARDFLNKSDMRPSPIQRARICSYLYSGLKRFRMHVVVDLIPLLLHTSLLFFFAGLVAFLYPVNRGMTLVAAAFLGVVAFFYSALTIMPLLFADCPCRTPLSGVLWRVWQLALALCAALRRAAPTAPERASDLDIPISQPPPSPSSPVRNETPKNFDSSFRLPASGEYTRSRASFPDSSMEDVMLRRAIAPSARRAERDKRALCWTLKSLTAEHELEPFVEAAPDVIWSWAPFARRRKHDHLLQVLLDDPGVLLGARLATLLLTCDSSLLERSVRQRRTVLCLKALLAFAMAAELDPAPPCAPLVFSFEASTLVYMARTEYPPALPYLPALRACSRWNAFCALVSSVRHAEAHLAAEYEVCMKEGQMARSQRVDQIRKAQRVDALILSLRDVLLNQERYARARGVPLYQEDSYSRMHTLVTTSRLKLYQLRGITPPEWMWAVFEVLRDVIGNPEAVQLDILRTFLLESARSEAAPYNFKETNEILRPKGILHPDVVPPGFGSTLPLIVEKLKNDSVVTHVDRVVGVYLPLLDSIADLEHYAADALTTYLNGRDLPAAVLRVLRDCDAGLAWARITRRVARRERPDDVVTAIWRLCSWLLDARFSAQLAAIPLQSFVDAFAVLPVSQYTCSVAAILRTVALYSVETIIRADAVHENPDASSKLRIDTNVPEFEYLALGSVSTPPSDGEMLSTEPDDAGTLSINDLHSRISVARLALLIEFMGVCTSGRATYNPAETLAHIVSSTSTTTEAMPPHVQNQLCSALQEFVDAAIEEQQLVELLRIVLECPLFAGLQWLDDPVAIAVMRRALDAAFLANPLPVVSDILARLRLSEDTYIVDAAGLYTNDPLG
ncbi:hypothetical protein B0H10DRAFT_63719 [Mycena sp. CBHHK59/15]|nr:hypothetical protein B0H10DRAFT_63719 [Mycena sp. CBHHK59/15]